MILGTFGEALPFLGIAFFGLIVLIASTRAAVVWSRRTGTTGTTVIWAVWVAVALVSLLALFVVGSIAVGHITCPPDIAECPV